MSSVGLEIENGAVGLTPGMVDQVMEDAAVGRSWYAVSVYPRHEKQVAQMCQAKGVNYLLPLYSSLRRWKDRKKRLEMVLFPGYVFVNIALTERLRVLVLPGVARFVTFHGQPAVVSDCEIRALGVGVESGLSIQPHPYLQRGRRVRVRNGPMAGVEGILVRRKDSFRVIISIDMIARSVAAEVDEGDIEPLL
ncbi:MAG: UpxY family transcription antiterminator [Terriglobales bacterium]